MLFLNLSSLALLPSTLLVQFAPGHTVQVLKNASSSLLAVSCSPPNLPGRYLASLLAPTSGRVLGRFTYVVLPASAILFPSASFLEGSPVSVTFSFPADFLSSCFLLFGDSRAGGFTFTAEGEVMQTLSGLAPPSNLTLVAPLAMEYQGRRTQLGVSLTYLRRPWVESLAVDGSMCRAMQECSMTVTVSSPPSTLMINSSMQLRAWGNSEFAVTILSRVSDAPPPLSSPSSPSSPSPSCRLPLIVVQVSSISLDLLVVELRIFETPRVSRLFCSLTPLLVPGGMPSSSFALSFPIFVQIPPPSILRIVPASLDSSKTVRATVFLSDFTPVSSLTALQLSLGSVPLTPLSLLFSDDKGLI